MAHRIISTGTTGLLVDGQPIQGNVRITQDQIDVTRSSEPDPNWVHIDGCGHEHRWRGGPDPVVPLTKPQDQVAVLPSLLYVLDEEPHWCEMCDGEYQPGRYQCLICGEVVSPRFRPTIGRHYIPGLKHVNFTVNAGLPLGPVMVTVPGDPPTIYPGRVVENNRGRSINGESWGTSEIVATGPPKEPEGRS